jgi:hypothetical protein
MFNLAQFINSLHFKSAIAVVRYNVEVANPIADGEETHHDVSDEGE